MEFKGLKKELKKILKHQFKMQQNLEIYENDLKVNNDEKYKSEGESIILIEKLRNKIFELENTYAIKEKKINEKISELEKELIKSEDIRNKEKTNYIKNLQEKEIENNNIIFGLKEEFQQKISRLTEQNDLMETMLSEKDQMTKEFLEEIDIKKNNLLEYVSKHENFLKNYQEMEQYLSEITNNYDKLKRKYSKKNKENLELQMMLKEKV